MSELKEKVKTFVVENYLFGDANGLTDETSFLGEGIIDSTGVLELVNFLQSTFNITVENEELIPDYLDSLNKVTAFVRMKAGHPN